MTRRYELNISSVKCGNIIIFPTNHQVDFCLIKLNAWPLSLFVNLREKKGNFEGKVPLPVFCTSFSIVVLCTAAAKYSNRRQTEVPIIGIGPDIETRNEQYWAILTRMILTQFESFFGLKAILRP